VYEISTVASPSTKGKGLGHGHRAVCTTRVSKAAVCVVEKEVCSAIVQVLLPRYIKVPTGDSLKVVNGFSTSRDFHNAVVLWMALIFPSCLPMTFRLTTLTVRVGRVVLKPGTERNGTNGTVVCHRRDEGRTYFCLLVCSTTQAVHTCKPPRLVHTVQKVCIAE